MAKKAEVLLLKPLPPKGNAGDVIDVKIHFAQHVLIPQGIAVFNTKQVQNQRTSAMKQIAKNKADLHASVEHMVTALAEKDGITFTKAVTETGGLYDSISNKNIAHYLEDTYNVTLGSSNVVMTKIEQIGDYEAILTYDEITATIPVHVIAEASA
jgi:ribosomal protein L9